MSYYKETMSYHEGMTKTQFMMQKAHEIRESVLKARIAKLKRQPRKKGATRIFSYNIPKEGSGQVALVGPPNSGKSSLMNRLTNASPEVADYPFTTREPQPGMMPFEDIAIQLVDLPPLSEEYVEHWVYDIIRKADFVLAVGSCATYGGIPAAEGNETGAVSVRAVVWRR